jgi:hypothetical protein
MSGHNHRRGGGYRDPKFNQGQRTSSYQTFGAHADTPLSGQRISACAVNGDATDGSKGVRKSRAGAKKFIHSRTRHHEDAALIKIADDIMVNGPDDHKD